MKAMNLLTMVMLGLIVSSLSIAAEKIELIQLEHTIAEEIIPIIKPLLQPDVVVTGKGYQLIVRAPALNLDSIQSIIRQIDVPKHQLKITLRQVDHSKEHGSRISTTGPIDLGGNAEIVLGEDEGGQNNDIIVRARNHSTHGRDDILYEVQTTEGRATFLRLGKSIPYELQRFITTGKHSGYERHMGYKQLYNGLFVVPRIQGEFVNLEISSQRQQFSEDVSGGIDSRHVRSVVRGLLGTWIRLGTTEHGQEVSKNRLTSQTLTTEKSGFSVQVKVELVH